MTLMAQPILGEQIVKAFSSFVSCKIQINSLCRTDQPVATNRPYTGTGTFASTAGTLDPFGLVHTTLRMEKLLPSGLWRAINVDLDVAADWGGDDPSTFFNRTWP